MRPQNFFQFRKDKVTFVTIMTVEMLTHTHSAQHILSCTVVAQIARLCVQPYHAHAWLKIEVHLCVRHRTQHPLRAMSFAALDTMHRHSFLHLFWSSDHYNTATIHGPFSVALLRNYHLLQIVSPTGLLTTGTAYTSPKTVSSLNLRMYVSNPCPTTSRFQLQPVTQRKASRRHQKRTLMTNNFVLC